MSTTTTTNDKESGLSDAIVGEMSKMSFNHRVNKKKRQTASVAPQIGGCVDTLALSSSDPRLANKRRRESCKREKESDDARDRGDVGRETSMIRISESLGLVESVDNDDRVAISNDKFDNATKFSEIVKFIAESTRSKIVNRQQTDLINYINECSANPDVTTETIATPIPLDIAESRLVDRPNGDNGKKKTILTLRERPRNFHEFTFLLYTLSKLPKQSKDSLKRDIRTIFGAEEIAICVGAFKKKTARELFQFLTYQIGNPQNLKNQVKCGQIHKFIKPFDEFHLVQFRSNFDNRYL